MNRIFKHYFFDLAAPFISAKKYLSVPILEL